MTVTSTGAYLDLENTRCHVVGVPCSVQGTYLVTYLDKNSYGVDSSKNIDNGLVTYGSCDGHISKMRLGCGDLVYVSDKRIES